MRIHLSITVLGLAAATVQATAAQDITVGGQVRSRFEFHDSTASGSEGFVSMRIRADVSAALEHNVRLFLQLQDVRLWGEETNTLTDFRADNFDIHQGYLELRSSNDGALSARVGRQEVSFGGQRLLGAVDWTQQGRAFDGVRVAMRGAFGTIDLLGFVLGDATAPDIQSDASLFGAYAQLDAQGLGTFDLYGLFNHVSGIQETNQATLGFRLVGRQSRISYRAEGSYQAGDRSGMDVAAFMLGAEVGAALAGDAAGVTLWYDYLSGDDDPTDGDIKVFDTLFATNHIFYGLADLFLNIPAHTNAMGLRDVAVKARYAPIPNLRLNLDLHSFELAKQGTLQSGHLADEIDLTATYGYSENVAVIGGLSRVLSGSALAATGRLTDDVTFVYLMVNATF